MSCQPTEKEQLFGVSHRRTGLRKCSIPTMFYVDGDNCVSLRRSNKSEIVEHTKC